MIFIFQYFLLKYNVTTYSQGSADCGVDYALIHAPEDIRLGSLRDLLFKKMNRKDVYEIDINSIKNQTILWEEGK